jgi:lipopolysaccharide export system protein LptA
MRTLATLAVVLAPVLAWAQPIVWHPDETPPLQITADRLSVDKANNLVVLSGNVRVVQGDVGLWCKTALIRYRAVALHNRTSVDQVECEQ